jgi:drug/metabolite transporter (DMT)-like permease
MNAHVEPRYRARERHPPHDRVAVATANRRIVVSIAGVALVVSGGEASAHSSRPLLGAVWMLTAVVTWAIYTAFATPIPPANTRANAADVSISETLVRPTSG